MKDCKTCGRVYDEKSFNDTVWHTREWGCRQRIKDGKETTKEEKDIELTKSKCKKSPNGYHQCDCGTDCGVALTCQYCGDVMF